MGRYIYILFFNQMGNDAIGNVGDKNVFRGQMYHQIVPIGMSTPIRFSSSALGYRLYTKRNNPDKTLMKLFMLPNILW